VRLGQALLVAALVLPWLARVTVPPGAIFPAPMQVSRGGDAAAGVALAFTATVPRPGPTTTAHGDQLLLALALALLAGSVFGLARLGLGAWRLRRLCRAATAWRRVGRVTLAVSEHAAAPFAVALGRRAFVVLPEAFVLAPGHLRLAVAHELGHVRAGDTAWIYLTALLAALFPWHPAAHAWGRWLSRQHELACDERVTGRPGVSARSYAECLVWAAEVAAGSWQVPALAAPMLESPRAFMERRIDMVLSRPSRKSRTFAMPLLVAGALAALAGAAAVAHGAVADRRVSSDEARAIADDLARAGGLRVPVDSTVVDELNQIVGDPTARAKFKEGLERLSAYRAAGEAALRRHGVPPELVAIPQVESRVQPLPAAQNRLGCAGRWQFLPATGRHYGLRIDAAAGVDDRFDQAREVDAAARYLADLHAALQDWPLAIAAYNNGLPQVRVKMTKTGATDAAGLVKARAISPYSSQVLAAILLIHRPALLD
jgi:hypothetical protein